MKKLLNLCICIFIGIVLLTGCGKDSGSAAPAETEDSVAAPDSSLPVDIDDWTPTTFGTVNNLEGVTMTVKEGTISPNGLTLQFENTSSIDCIYGEYFLLEKKISGAWYQVPVTIEGDYGYNTIGYSLVSDGDSEWATDWEWIYGSLDTGEYRIVKDILDLRDPGDYDTYYLAAVFTLS